MDAYRHGIRRGLVELLFVIRPGRTILIELRLTPLPSIPLSFASSLGIVLGVLVYVSEYYIAICVVTI